MSRQTPCPLNGTIRPKENGEATKKGVFAGGDPDTGSANRDQRYVAGKIAALAIDELPENEIIIIFRYKKRNKSTLYIYIPRLF